MGIIPAFCFLLIFGNIIAEETCENACDHNFKDNKTLEGCRDGCHIAASLAILSPENSETKCEEACIGNYNDTPKVQEACKYACKNSHNNRPGPFVSAERDAISGIIRKEFGEMIQSENTNFMSPFQSSFEQTIEKMEALRRLMLMRLRQHFSHPGFLEEEIGTGNRPCGHLAAAFKGPEVGNKDINGEEIVHVKPVKHRRIIFSVYTDPSHFAVSRTQRPVEESSFFDHFSQRRMSILSQWLICIALLLCLLSLMGISFAIIRQIKLQQRLRARQAHVIIPVAHEQPLPAKKVPLETPGTAIDYPLIHDTPPPAYDQLSLRKEKVQDP